MFLVTRRSSKTSGFCHEYQTICNVRTFYFPIIIGIKIEVQSAHSSFNCLKSVLYSFVPALSSKTLI